MSEFIEGPVGHYAGGDPGAEFITGPVVPGEVLDAPTDVMLPGIVASMNEATRARAARNGVRPGRLGFVLQHQDQGASTRLPSQR